MAINRLQDLADITRLIQATEGSVKSQVHYIVRSGNWSFQIYKTEIDKRLDKFGENFSLIIGCGYGDQPSYPIFVLPYSKIKGILAQAKLDDKGRYTFAVTGKDADKHMITFQVKQSFDGNEFLENREKVLQHQEKSTDEKQLDQIPLDSDSDESDEIDDEVGEPMELGLMNRAPTHENGVIALFASYHKELGFPEIEFIRSQFPDAGVFERVKNEPRTHT